ARILFKTHQSLRADDEWDSNFPPVDPDLVEALSAEGVLLLGTDAPSVDPYESKTLTSHHALARQGIHILENLRLQGVPEGEYLLVAAPLKLEGMDGAPVRALLIAD